jgi:type I site-specific restriction-modification system R (restriction) subunit
MVTLQKSAPRWLARPVPPPPPDQNPIETALNDYETLRGNYINVCGQLAEAHDIARELSHQNEVLGSTIKEDREYYQAEIDRLQRRNDMLAAYSASINTRLATIVEVIQSANREAKESGVAALTVAATERLQVTQELAHDHFTEEPDLGEAVDYAQASHRN